MTVITERYLTRDGARLKRNNKLLRRVSQTGLYSPARLWNMINFQGYRPVASAVELDAIRSTAVRKWGEGTEFEIERAGGLGEKYVLVDDVDLIGIDWFPLQGPIAQPFAGVFQGNGFSILNIFPRGLFATVSGQILNVNVGISNSLVSKLIGANSSIINCTVKATVENVLNCRALICRENGDSVNQGGLIDKCKVVNSSFTQNEFNSIGLICGINANGGKITNCKVINSKVINNLMASGPACGAICGISNHIDNIIEDCEVIDCDIQTLGLGQAGLIVGSQLNGAKVYRSFSKDSIVYSNGNAGGISGTINNNSGRVIDSYSINCVINGDLNAGGIVGNSSNSPNIINSYAVCTFPGTGAKGGVRGAGTAVLVNSYYDSTVAGFTTATGLPRTTAQLQTALPNQYINPNGTIDGTSNAANLMYSGWDRNKWLFGPRSKYPRLKKAI
jgi:hypothetical protein